jgi:hypothetical protein
VINDDDDDDDDDDDAQAKDIFYVISEDLIAVTSELLKVGKMILLFWIMRPCSLTTFRRDIQSTIKCRNRFF